MNNRRPMTRPMTTRPHPRRHARRRRRRRGCAPRVLALFLIILIASIWAYTLFAGNSEPTIIDYENQNPVTAQPQEGGQSPQPNEETPEEPALPSRLPDISLAATAARSIQNTGYLALVNHSFAAPGDPGSYLLSPAWPTVAVARIEGTYLHQSALRAVSDMFASARAADMNAFFVSSGFRDFSHQEYLYGDGSAGNLIMPPGHSEHQTGLAADIMVVGLGMWDLVDAPEGQWLANNSYRYGLVLRYPQGAEHITGIDFEPWHFRYVGQVHAYYMMNNGFVLEEYIQYIRDRGHFSFEKNGITHYVFHQEPAGGMIYVPQGRDFTMSGDNKGGYIIWTTQ
ncbi:MAG: M15 family metallopeptidase [Defluviitaleaceae bacterium]|nr:M15 family metallopeptidase [Defluviitaleaceae bacterium]